MRLVPLIVAVLALAAGPAAAQRLPASSAPAERNSGYAAPSEAANSPDPRIKSRSRAQLLALHSVVATAVGAALLSQSPESELSSRIGYPLLVYGTVVAPSAGHLYAGDERRAMQGVVIRGAGGALIVASMIGFALTSALDEGELYWGWDPVNVTGSAIIVAGAAYSIARTPTSVAEHNDVVRRSPPLAVTPAIRAGRDGVGMGVQLRF